MTSIRLSDNFSFAASAWRSSRPQGPLDRLLQLVDRKMETLERLLQHRFLAADAASPLRYK